MPISIMLGPCGAARYQRRLVHGELVVSGYLQVTQEHSTGHQDLSQSSVCAELASPVAADTCNTADTTHTTSATEVQNRKNLSKH